MPENSILVVEDEHTLRRLLEYRLKKQYDVRTAANGEEALEMVSDQVPDLIISDIMMPKMDGFALQTALQQNPATRAVPFIFLTAKADEQSRLRGRRTGVDDYITKPFDIDHLLSRVDLLLDRAKQFQEKLQARISQDFSSSLMPKEAPSADGYRLFFHNDPREDGGGDMYDWVEVQPGVFFITIGDVMGKGLKAKFYAFSFWGYIRSSLRTMLRSTQSPAEAMTRINQALAEDPPLEDTFASLLLMKWEPDKNLLTYTNAGHCRPVQVTGRESKIVTYSDLVLGLDPGAEFRDTAISLSEGTAIMSYTDGLMEQKMRSGEQLGEDGVVRVAAKAYGTENPVQSVIEKVLDESVEKRFADDIMIFWLERETQRERKTPRWF
ncbi:MAG: SpoIIE family protein phosphatase, partial [Rhodothermales bacterium]|nr:SpoIIE family protein phosphatase [Rhodothermales bacterium]